MTRAEHEEKFRVIRAAVRKKRLPLAREPDLPGLPHRRAQAAVRAVGLDHAQPVRLEGPVLPAHRRDLPDLRGAARRHRVGGLRAGQRPALRALRRSTPASSRRPRSWRPDSVKGDRPEHGMDADGVTFACATAAEAAGRAAARACARPLVGLGARERHRPRGRWSRSGSRARCGRPRRRDRGRRDARRRRRAARCSGKASRSAFAARTAATILGADAIVDDPAERAPPARAHAAPTRPTWRAASLARSGRLAGRAAGGQRHADAAARRDRRRASRRRRLRLAGRCARRSRARRAACVRASLGRATRARAARRRG